MCDSVLYAAGASSENLFLVSDILLNVWYRNVCKNSKTIHVYIGPLLINLLILCGKSHRPQPTADSFKAWLKLEMRKPACKISLILHFFGI